MKNFIFKVGDLVSQKLYYVNPVEWPERKVGINYLIVEIRDDSYGVICVSGAFSNRGIVVNQDKDFFETMHEKIA
jgi:hypothetical protein